MPYALKKILVKYGREFGLLETNKLVTTQQVTTVHENNVLSETHPVTATTSRRKQQGLPHSLPFPQQQHALGNDNSTSKPSVSLLTSFPPLTSPEISQFV